MAARKIELQRILQEITEEDIAMDLERLAKNLEKLVADVKRSAYFIIWHYVDGNSNSSTQQQNVIVNAKPDGCITNLQARAKLERITDHSEIQYNRILQGIGRYAGKNNGSRRHHRL